MAGGIRQDSGFDLDESHEINVTPFIDVMLVLLIIFMVAAPLATVDMNVDLPASTAQPADRPDKPLYLTIQADHTLAVGEEKIPREELATALERATDGDKETRVFLRADKTVDYGSLTDTLNALRAAGYLKVALVGLELTPQAAQAANGQANVQAAPAAGGVTAP
ncbi:TonB system transport protein ExbD [Sinirhodobacter populi]|uniref:Biopolymer transport protein ExbD n=1 Tax=Paenirhodobacter populi TaxID=2306993 RepID=A0A443K6F8_9RHOB|nr:TonB system transport protein ExbD [Sinirhodobacter populi]RWR28263.1 TonB system transport protein ExbD [Sinirhodobacter populi]